MSPPARALTAFGSRVGRHSVIYGGGSAVGVTLGLASILITTLYLEPSEFGKLAVLLVLSSGLTILYNLGSLQGSFQLVFGAVDGDEEGGFEEDVADAPLGDKRRALGTAITLTAGIGLVGTAALWPFASGIAHGLLGEGASAADVQIALGMAALGAVWRLLVNVPRLERRPVVFIALNALRPSLVIAVMIPVLAAGGGVRSALLANLAGTGTALAVALAISARSYTFAFSRADARQIAVFGREWVPLVIALWIAGNADLLVLNVFASTSDVGTYRLASRICVVLSFASSAIFMAWLPLARSVLFEAVQQEHGPRVNALLAQYYVVLMSGLVLALALASEVLVSIAPDSYRAAAELVPLLAVAMAAQGGYYLAYRTSTHPLRRRLYMLGALAAAALLVAIAYLLVPPLGSPGAALAPLIAFGVVIVAMVMATQRGPSPVPFDTRRTLLPPVLATGLYALVHALPSGGLPEIGASLIALLAFPLLLMGTGLVPSSHARGIVEIVRGSLPSRGMAARYGARILTLPAADRHLLDIASRPNATLDTVARETGRDASWVGRRLVGALRVAGRLPGPAAPYDERVGRHLLEDAPPAASDVAARALIQDGIPARDLDDLITTFQAVRRNRRGIRRVGATASDD